MSTLWLIFCKEKELWILSSVHVESSAGRVVLPRLQASIQHCENPPIFYLKITFGQKKPNTSSSPNAKGFLVIQHEVYWNSGVFLCLFFFTSQEQDLFSKDLLRRGYLDVGFSKSCLRKESLRLVENERKSESEAPRVKVNKQWR